MVTFYHRPLYTLSAVIFALVLALPAWSAHPARAQDWEDAVATLEIITGEATITFSTAPDATILSAGSFAPIAAGDQIEISDPGEATLTFFEGESTRLTAGTQLVVEQFDKAGDAVRIRFNVLVGQTLSAVSNALDAESQYEVNTPAANVSIRGTEFVVFVRPDQLTQVATTDGTVNVSAQGANADVPCGYGLKVAPGEALGDVTVWGNTALDLAAPIDPPPGIPVRMINQQTGHIYYYHADDPMLTVALGTYDLYLDIPGPVRVSDLDFPTDTPLLSVENVALELGAVQFEIVDATGQPVENPDDLIVTLTQGEQSGTTVAAPGEPLLVGPGAWIADIRSTRDPDNTLTLEMTATGGELATVPLQIGTPAE